MPWPKTALKTAWQDTNQARVSLISEGFKLQIVFGDTFHRLLLRLYHPPQKIGSPKTFLAFPWLFHQMFWSQRKRPISSRSVFFSISMGISGSNLWRYVSTIFQAIFSGDIPWNLGQKNRPFLYGRYLRPQSVPVAWPLTICFPPVSPRNHLLDVRQGPRQRLYELQRGSTPPALGGENGRDRRQRMGTRKGGD